MGKAEILKKATPSGNRKEGMGFEDIQAIEWSGSILELVQWNLYTQ